VRHAGGTPEISDAEISYTMCQKLGVPYATVKMPDTGNSHAAGTRPLQVTDWQKTVLGIDVRVTPP